MITGTLQKNKTSRLSRNQEVEAWEHRIMEWKGELWSHVQPRFEEERRPIGQNCLNLSRM
jgi:hypothetical protein